MYNMKLIKTLYTILVIIFYLHNKIAYLYAVYSYKNKKFKTS